MRRLKWILGGLLALVVALVVTGYAILAGYDVESLKTLIQQEAQARTGRELVIAGGAEMRVSFTPAVVLEDVHLRNAAGGEARDLVSMRRFELEVALWPLIAGDIEVKRLVLVEPVVALERNAEGRTNWDLGTEQTADGGSSWRFPSFQTLRIENGHVTYRDSATDERRDLKLALLEATAATLETAVSGAATGTLDSMPFDLTLALGSLRQLASDEAFPVKATGTLAGGAVALEGRLAMSDSDASELALSLDGDSLEQLSPVVGVALPASQPYSLSLQLKRQGTAASLENLALTLGESDLSGSLGLDWGGERPRLTGALASKRLVLGELFGPTEPAEGAGDRLFPDAPLPFHLLDGVDAELSLTAASLELRERQLADVTASLTLADGALTLDPLGFTYQGGKLAGKLRAEAAEQPSVALQLQGDGLDAAAATNGLVTGRYALALDLAGHGDSPRALASSLTGSSEVSTSDAVVHDGLLKVAASGLGGVLGPLFGKADELRLTCAVSRFAWVEGIGTSQGMVADSATFTATASGTIDLRSETLKLYVDTATKEPSLASLAVPFTVAGPLAAPSVSPDPAGTALGLARAAGIVLFPPAGLAVLIGEKATSQQGNACVAAVQEVKEEGGPAKFFEGLGQTLDDAAKGAGDAAKGAGEVIEKGFDDAVKGVKGLFD